MIRNCTLLAILIAAMASTLAAARARPLSHGSRQAARVGLASPPKKFPIGVTWRLKQINGRPAPTAKRATLTIDSTLRGTGSAGCDSWSATVYPVANQRLAMGPIATTHRACSPQAAAFERMYLNALHSGPVWDEEQGYLVLKTTAGVMRFSRGFF
ncbi:MAG TPA: META domain-containing protein [Beijerinckiaceae bacterium]|nr:META domain-containing protein [Beijerinckiaceae bacterium]